jgi:NADP-reducing hydrogenase subunit HndC
MDIYKKHVFVCTEGKTCPKEGSKDLCDRLREIVKDKGLKKQIRINKSGCLDQCGNGAVMVVYPDAVWYARVKVSDAKEIVEKHLIEDCPVKRLFYDGRGKQK